MHYFFYAQLTDGNLACLDEKGETMPYDPKTLDMFSLNWLLIQQILPPKGGVDSVAAASALLILFYLTCNMAITKITCLYTFIKYLERNDMVDTNIMRFVMSH